MKAIGSLLLGLVFAMYWLLTTIQPHGCCHANPELRAQELVRAVPGLALPNQTETPTDVPTDTPTPTETPTDVPTNTSTPTETPTDVPTDTPTLTQTPTEVPTDTPTPTATLTEVPTDTPTPTATLTEVPTNTPTPTFIPNVKLTHGPVVGAVTDSTARVFVRTSDIASVKIRYGKLADLSDAIESPSQQTSAEHDFTTIISLTNLNSETVYYLDIVINNVRQLAAVYPQFNTFPPPGTSKPFSFVYLTDSSVLPNPPLKTFVNAGNENPAFAVLGGDFPHGKSLNIVAKRFFYKAIYDPTTGETIRDFVNQILYRYPVAHMWDNHDYGMPANKYYPLRAVNMQVIQEYFPTYSLTQYGDWQKFSYAQAEFFILDSRSQRDSNRDPDGPDKSMLDGDHLGATGQLEWLKTGLKESTARWKFILSPVPFNPTAKPKTSWGAFQFERQVLMDFIRDNGITGVISVTGDLHMGAIDDGTHSTIPEMVVPGPNGAGCISTAFPGQWSKGTYGKEGQRCNGYGVIRLLTNPPRVRLIVKDSDGKIKLKYTVK